MKNMYSKLVYIFRVSFRSYFHTTKRNILVKTTIVLVYGIVLITSFICFNNPFIRSLQGAINDYLLKHANNRLLIEFHVILMFVIQRK
jgi:hypothetical protein